MFAIGVTHRETCHLHTLPVGSQLQSREFWEQRPNCT